MLKFITYKQVTTELVSILRDSGYEVFYVASPDSDMDITSVCQKANAENYILLTSDLDLAQEVLKGKRITSGLLYVQHVPDVSSFKEAGVVMRAVQKHGEDISFSYTEIIGETVRIKKLEGA